MKIIIIVNGEFTISVPEASAGSTLATHGRSGAMRGRRQPPEILITRPSTAGVKQGKFFLHEDFTEFAPMRCDNLLRCDVIIVRELERL